MYPGPVPCAGCGRLPRRAGIGDFWSDAGGWITGAASTVGGWLASAASTVQAVAAVFGFVGTNFQLTAVIQVLRGQFSASQLWTALGQDWQAFWKDKDIAQQLPQALTDGDYTKAWNIATNNGAAYAQLKAALGIDQPQPQPQPDHQQDALNLAAQAQAGGVDYRAVAQQLYDWGYYTDGDLVMQMWTNSVATTPIGATFGAMQAVASGNPVGMMAWAAMLQSAESDPVVQANWTYGGTPATLFDPLIAKLTASAQAAVQAQAAASAPPATSSTAATVAKVALVSAGAGALGLLAYARAHHLGYGQAAQKVWGEVRSAAHRARMG